MHVKTMHAKSTDTKTIICLVLYKYSLCGSFGLFSFVHQSLNVISPPKKHRFNDSVYLRPVKSLKTNHSIICKPYLTIKPLNNQIHRTCLNSINNSACS